MVERDEAAFELLVVHEQLSEPFEPAMTNLNHPASVLLGRVTPLGIGFCTPTNDWAMQSCDSMISKALRSRHPASEHRCLLRRLFGVLRLTMQALRT